MAAGSPAAGAAPERTADELAQLLAPTLGREKSEELVLAVASELGFTARELTADQALQIVTRLAGRPGIVGITARFAVSRLTPAAPSSTPRPPRAPSPEERTPSSQVQPTTLPLSDLAALLAPSMGNERAEELVRAATRHHATTGGRITPATALAVLEELAREPGLVGVTARFAKARFALRLKT